MSCSGDWCTITSPQLRICSCSSFRPPCVSSSLYMRGHQSRCCRYSISLTLAEKHKVSQQGSNLMLFCLRHRRYQKAKVCFFRAIANCRRNMMCDKLTCLSSTSSSFCSLFLSNSWRFSSYSFFCCFSFSSHKIDKFLSPFSSSWAIFFSICEIQECIWSQY